MVALRTAPLPWPPSPDTDSQGEYTMSTEHDWQCNTPARERDDGNGRTDMEVCSRCRKHRYVHILCSHQTLPRIEYMDAEGNPTDDGTSLHRDWSRYSQETQHVQALHEF